MITNRYGRAGRTAQRVVDAYAADPNATMRQIAERVGTTFNYVRCLRQRRRDELPRKPSHNPPTEGSTP